jgi:hypothetical protein
MSEYPEHNKLKAIREKSQAVGEFLDWLPEEGITLCSFSDENEHYYPCQLTIQQLLAKYFQIDLEVLEKEKQHMLEEIRAQNPQ